MTEFDKTLPNSTVAGPILYNLATPKKRNTKSYKTESKLLEEKVDYLNEKVADCQINLVVAVVIALIGWMSFIIALLEDAMI